MRSATPVLVTALAVSIGTGCVTGTRSGSVLGRPVTVVPAPGSGGERVKGELIAVEPEKIWVLGKEHVVEVPVSAIQELRVQRHRLDTRRGWAWTGIGALVTGGALALACSSVKGNNNCGGVFAGVALSWVVLGGLPSTALDHSATIRLKQPEPEELRPYARFPQGPPEGLDLRQLPPRPDKPQ